MRSPSTILCALLASSHLCLDLHLIHIFSSCSYVLYRQMYWTSSAFLCFTFMISCQASPSFLIYSSTSRTVLFSLSHRSVSSKLYLGSIHFFKWAYSCGCFFSNSVKILKHSISFLSCFHLATSQKPVCALLGLDEKYTWMKVNVI
jgi:hypothetical protein